MGRKIGKAIGDSGGGSGQDVEKERKDAGKQEGRTRRDVQVVAGGGGTAAAIPAAPRGCGSTPLCAAGVAPFALISAPPSN